MDIKDSLTHPVLARDIMTVDTVTLDENLGLYEAAEKLARLQVSNAPVVKPDFTRELLVGFVSEKDLIQAYANGWFYQRPDLKVRDVMRCQPVCVKPETDLFTLAAIFIQHGFRHVPVVKAHILEGMVSRHDVLKALVGHYRDWQLAPPDRRSPPPDLAAIFTPRFLVG